MQFDGEESSILCPMGYSGTRGRLRVLPLTGLVKREYRPRPTNHVFRLSGFKVNTYVGCHRVSCHNMVVSIMDRVLTVQREGKRVEVSEPSEDLYCRRTNSFYS